MKRELKQEMTAEHYSGSRIAEPIPMKRELKRNPAEPQHSRSLHCRAYPDEKGIETLIISQPWSRWWIIAEPIPMKRELKHCNAVGHVLSVALVLQSLSRWKGNWNISWSCPSIRSLAIAEPIPMKRELKRSSRFPSIVISEIAEPIPMKRELKH